MRRITSIDADVSCDARTMLSQRSRGLDKLQDSTLQRYTAVADRCSVNHLALEATVRHDTAAMLLWIYVADTLQTSVPRELLKSVTIVNLAQSYSWSRPISMHMPNTTHKAYT